MRLWPGASREKACGAPQITLKTKFAADRKAAVQRSTHAGREGAPLMEEVLPMSKQSSPMLHIKKEAAAFRLRQLLDELGMLMGSFPDLREAFDPDELPLEFILKRDSQTEPVGSGSGRCRRG